jgi:hypothetical protein
MRGGTGFSQKAVLEDHQKWTEHVARSRVFHGMVMPVVRGGADADLTWGCARWAWGAHEVAWLCSRGKVQFWSQVSTSIRKSNKIAKIPGKFMSPCIESWESYHCNNTQLKNWPTWMFKWHMLIKQIWLWVTVASSTTFSLHFFQCVGQHRWGGPICLVRLGVDMDCWLKRCPRRPKT